MTRFATYLKDERYPIVVKLHGDFRVDQLKNTAAEVQTFDSELRKQLVETSRSYGLVVVGYSGRDKSVMDSLRLAIEQHGAEAYPEGLYWCLRTGEDQPARVHELLSDALAVGIRAAFVRIPDFDDFAANVYRSSGTSHDLVDARLAERQRTRTGYSLVSSGTVEPVLKFNAVPVTKYPEACYRFKARLEGWADLRTVINGHDVVAGLFKGEVLALGSRGDIQNAFESRQIEGLRASPVGLADLRVEGSVTLGMFYDALIKGLTPTSVLCRGGKRFVFLTGDEAMTPFMAEAFAVTGLGKVVREVKSSQYWVHEAAELALEFREGRLWLLFRPTIFMTEDGKTTPWDGEGKMELVRQAMATRYNRVSSALYTFWLRVIWGCTQEGELTFPKDANAGAVAFRLEQTLGTSFYRS